MPLNKETKPNQTNLLNHKKRLISLCIRITSNCLQKMKKNWSLIQTIRIYSQDIGMEFSKEKCAILIMKNGKRQTLEEIELPNLERVGTLEEKENYKYLEILGADTMKEKIRKKFLRQTRKLLETKLCSRNLIHIYQPHRSGRI